jgi:serine protease Do
MKKSTSAISFLIVLSILALTACSSPAAIGSRIARQLTANMPAQNVLNNQPAAQVQKPTAAPSTNNQAAAADPALLSAYEGALENIYTQVNPSVVNIRVVMSQSASGFSPGEIPGLPSQENPDSSAPVAQALGSGFVWDSAGHIVTNNHVVDGADKVEVTFSDGTIAPATIVGTDKNSDLAVVKVDVAADKLHPVQLANSDEVKVGQLAIAIGNPFGLQNTMTAGIVSALDRSLPVGEGLTAGPVYSIPDIIQTDAPINPGNSGGVLVDNQGQVIGVTAAIESQTGQNSGIGFVIPSNIVQKVVPSLIKTGTYAHSWIGISGTTLTPDLAKAMNLNSDQRGALVEDVTSGGPADKAGLKASADQVSINGTNVNVGGDVITAIDGQPVNGMDDLIAYLTNSTEVGQKITLTVLRDGSQTTVDITLEARPDQTPQVGTTEPSNPQSNTPRNPTTPQNPTNPSAPTTPRNSVYLGISGLAVNSDIASAMNLDANTQGILIEQVQANSPAEAAGLQGGSQQTTIGGTDLLLGGDIIIAVDGQSVATVQDILTFLRQAKVGQDITVTIIRDGSQTDVPVTLAARPQ